jgi:hypothetical protein
MTMSSRFRHGVWATFALVVGASSLEAQSLGDVARQAEARRQGISGTAKVYTNDNVRNDRPAPSPPVAAEPSTDTPPAQADANDAAASSATAATEKKDEVYWRKRLTSERDALSRAQMFAEALQSRINGLSADFVARDDPAQRSVIAKDRDKALAELERVRREIQDHTKALASIQEEGRRAGAPAGWLR